MTTEPNSTTAAGTVAPVADPNAVAAASRRKRLAQTSATAPETPVKKARKPRAVSPPTPKPSVDVFVENNQKLLEIVIAEKNALAAEFSDMRDRYIELQRIEAGIYAAAAATADKPTAIEEQPSGHQTDMGALERDLVGLGALPDVKDVVIT